MQNNTEKLLVEMRDIVKTFPGTKALDGVTLKLRKGEIHALVGENGAGKSTLMNILTGQFAMDSGEVIMEGEPVRFSSPREAMRKKYSSGTSGIKSCTRSQHCGKYFSGK